jgi:hypothetical protein
MSTGGEDLVVVAPVRGHGRLPGGAQIESPERGFSRNDDEPSTSIRSQRGRRQYSISGTGKPVSLSSSMSCSVRVATSDHLFSLRAVRWSARRAFRRTGFPSSRPMRLSATSAATSGARCRSRSRGPRSPVAMLPRTQTLFKHEPCRLLGAAARYERVGMRLQRQLVALHSRTCRSAASGLP